MRFFSVPRRQLLLIDVFQQSVVKQSFALLSFIGMLPTIVVAQDLDAKINGNQDARARLQQNDPTKQHGEPNTGNADDNAEHKMMDQQNQIAHARGNLLNGTGDYVDPTTGETFHLSQTGPGNTFSETPEGPTTFFQDTQGKYQFDHSNAGYLQNLNDVK